MRSQRQKVLGLVLVSLLLVTVLLSSWSPHSGPPVDIQSRLPPDVLRLLQARVEEHLTQRSVPFHLKPSVAGRLATNSCACEGEESRLPLAHVLFPGVGAENLTSFFSALELPEVQQRRAREYQSFIRRTQTAEDLLVVAQANCPLQYPTQGLRVRPTHTVLIPGLALKQPARSLYWVKLTASLGTFDVAASVEGVAMRGEAQMSMTVTSRDLTALNTQLQFVTYTNTLFHPNTADTVQFHTDGHRAVFTIRVGHGVRPKLYDTHPGGEHNMSAMVTIATKTFLRYDKLKDLIDSIRQFYPSITIIVADDNQHPQPVVGPHIEHYIMPYGKGWFAGRSLAVSQVTTKYVLWVDDDFYFTSSTKLEKLVDVLESTTLDLVGGAVREVTGYTATYQHMLSVEAGGAEGDCLHVRRGVHHPVRGFPRCSVTDAVINFFLARTDKVRQVGFDPQLARVGHLEFFVDGLGSLHVGSCDDVIVSHASKIKLPWGQSENSKAYAKFRYPAASTKGFSSKKSVFYFKNHLQCMTSN